MVTLRSNSELELNPFGDICTVNDLSNQKIHFTRNIDHDDLDMWVRLMLKLHSTGDPIRVQKWLPADTNCSSHVHIHVIMRMTLLAVNPAGTS